MSNLNPLYVLLEGYTDKIIDLQRTEKTKEVLRDLLKKGNPFRQKLAAQIRATHQSHWIPAEMLRKLKARIIELQNQISATTDVNLRRELKRQLRNNNAKLRHIRKYGMLDSSFRNTNIDSVGRIGQDMEQLLDTMGLRSEYRGIEKPVYGNTFGNKVRKLFGRKPKQTGTDIEYVYQGGFINPDIHSKDTLGNPLRQLKRKPSKGIGKLNY